MNKKTILFLVPTFFILTSCQKKDWNCTCNVNGDAYAKTIKNTTKSAASSNCSDYGKSVGQSYGSYTYKCEVK
jgi:hypothetical protein